MEGGQGDRVGHVGQLVQVPSGVGRVEEVHQPLVTPGPQGEEVYCQHHGQGVHTWVKVQENFTDLQSSSVASSGSDIV